MVTMVAREFWLGSGGSRDSVFRIHGLPGVTALGISLGADQSFGSAALGARGEGANPPLEGSVSGRESGSEIVSGAFALTSGRPDLYPWGLMAMPVPTTTTTKKGAILSQKFCCQFF